jgi:hypothetical protein
MFSTIHHDLQEKFNFLNSNTFNGSTFSRSLQTESWILTSDGIVLMNKASDWHMFQAVTLSKYPKLDLTCSNRRGELSRTLKEWKKLRAIPLIWQWNWRWGWLRLIRDQEKLTDFGDWRASCSCRIEQLKEKERRYGKKGVGRGNMTIVWIVPYEQKYRLRNRLPIGWVRTQFNIGVNSECDRHIVLEHHTRDYFVNLGINGNIDKAIIIQKIISWTQDEFGQNTIWGGWVSLVLNRLSMGFLCQDSDCKSFLIILIEWFSFRFPISYMRSSKNSAETWFSHKFGTILIIVRVSILRKSATVC